MDSYDFIKNKVVSHAEVVICFFDHCNLNCVFCPQDHSKALGASKKEILAKIKTCIQWIKENKKSSIFKVHMMGGELFQDFWIEKGFLSIYQEVINELKNNIPSDKKVLPNFVTNLVFERREEVREFLLKNNLKISISYDPKGRFNNQQRDLFKSNIEYFKNEIEMASIVMTKQNMQAVQEGDTIFNYLYQNHICDWDHFLPSVKQSKIFIPSEKEVFNFYKFLIDHYPNCLNIQHFISENYEEKMICTRGNSLTILSDGSIPGGCSGAIFLRDAKTQNLESPGIVSDFIDKHNCFMCEYFKKCPFTCFIKEDYKYVIQDMDTCKYKEVFNYVQTTR